LFTATHIRHTPLRTSFFSSPALRLPSENFSPVRKAIYRPPTLPSRRSLIPFWCMLSSRHVLSDAFCRISPFLFKGGLPRGPPSPPPPTLAERRKPTFSRSGLCPPTLQQCSYRGLFARPTNTRGGRGFPHRTRGFFCPAWSTNRHMLSRIKLPGFPNGVAPRRLPLRFLVFYFRLFKYEYRRQSITLQRIVPP